MNFTPSYEIVYGTGQINTGKDDNCVRSRTHWPRFDSINQIRLMAEHRRPRSARSLHSDSITIERRRLYGTFENI